MDSESGKQLQTMSVNLFWLSSVKVRGAAAPDSRGGFARTGAVPVRVREGAISLEIC